MMLLGLWVYIYIDHHLFFAVCCLSFLALHDTHFALLTVDLLPFFCSNRICVCTPQWIFFSSLYSESEQCNLQHFTNKISSPLLCPFFCCAVFLHWHWTNAYISGSGYGQCIYKIITNILFTWLLLLMDGWTDFNFYFAIQLEHITYITCNKNSNNNNNSNNTSYWSLDIIQKKIIARSRLLTCSALTEIALWYFFYWTQWICFSGWWIQYFDDENATLSLLFVSILANYVKIINWCWWLMLGDDFIGAFHHTTH